MTTYEYQVIPTPPRRDTLYQLLNTLGAQGWRYLGQHEGHCVFEQAVPPPTFEDLLGAGREAYRDALDKLADL